MNTQLTEISVSGDITTTSLKLAELFEREHKNVLRVIRNIIKDFKGKEIGRLTCEPSYYKNNQGKSQPYYVFGEQLALIITGRLTGKNALTAQMKLANEFIAMRNHIRQQQKLFSPADAKMLAITRINPNTLKAISSTRNNATIRTNYLALVGAGILEEITELRSVTRYRFTLAGLDYSAGYYGGIPRFDEQKHALIIGLINEFANKQLSAQSDLFVSVD